MQEKKSKFTEEPHKLEEDKHQVSHKTLKKPYESLHVSVTKHSQSFKWQEHRVTSFLPERRSNMSACVYNGKYAGFYEYRIGCTFLAEKILTTEKGTRCTT